MSIDLNQLSDQQLYILKSRSNTPLTGLKRINMIKSIETKIKNGEIQIDEAKNFDMNISKKNLNFNNVIMARGGCFFEFFFTSQFSTKMSNCEFIFAIFICFLFFFELLVFITLQNYLINIRN
jgi:hypothetical protein